MLFVYGSLKRGHRRNFYLTRGGSRFMRETRTAPGYVLFRAFLADFAQLTEAPGGGAVEGELWDVPSQCLVDIDFVEGVPRLYQRRAVLLEDGGQADAYLARRRPLLSWNLGAFWTLDAERNRWRSPFAWS